MKNNWSNWDNSFNRFAIEKIILQVWGCNKYFYKKAIKR